MTKHNVNYSFVIIAVSLFVCLAAVVILKITKFSNRNASCKTASSVSDDAQIDATITDGLKKTSQQKYIELFAKKMVSLNFLT